MCSLSAYDSDTDADVLDKKIGPLSLREEDQCRTNNQSLTLKNEQLDLFSQLDGFFCEKFDINKSKVSRHRKEIIEECLKESQVNSKIADTINIHEAGSVRVGHIINITEKIIVNPNTSECELDLSKLKDYENHFTMVDRMHWLAQPSYTKKVYLKKPAHYVIICQTATQEVFTQAEQVSCLQSIQTNHRESKGFGDIAYNFCIGSDGNAYEGRGWFVEGCHTLSYNAYSLGIAFIGCFLDKLPPSTALQRCKDLIAHGVKIGAINQDYELLAHRQCPPDSLYEEIKTWDHFNPNIEIEN